MKAFIFDPLWDQLITNEQLRRLNDAGIEVIVTKQLKPLSECVELFDGDEDRVLCINPDFVNWSLDANDYKNVPNLKAILGAATSFSWIDTSFANESGIPVCNIRNFSSEAVSEWAVMIMLNLARQVPRLIKADFPLDFDKDFMEYRGMELHGKTVGIIGLGHIGKAIARRCAGLGMQVTYWSRESRANEYQYKELTELMAESDVVFPIFASNDETKNMITNELLDSMKASAILIDVVDIVDRKYLVEKVNNGSLFGFGFEAKPASFNDYAGNVWAAPAYGWVTDGSMFGTVEKWVDNMVSATKGEFPNRVN